MSYILEFTKSKGVKTIEEAFNLWIREGWVNASIDRQKEIYDHYLKERESFCKKDAITYTAEKFKYSERRVHSFIAFFEKTLS